MYSIDWALLTNWIVSGLIGLLFGLVGGYFTYKLEQKRDDIKWQREKHQLKLEWQQKLQELEIKFLREDRVRLREELLRGVDNPSAEIAKFRAWAWDINGSEFSPQEEYFDIIFKCMELFAEGIPVSEIKQQIYNQKYLTSEGTTKQLTKHSE
jgi:hypothetical protein